MDFLRKITKATGGYAMISVPKIVYKRWQDKGFTSVQMQYDDRTETIVVVPL